MTLNLDEIRNRAERATPGPWMRIVRGEAFAFVCATASTLRIGTQHDGGVRPLNDLEFIANARTDVPTLCDEIERLREESAELRGTIAAMSCDASTSQQFALVEKFDLEDEVERLTKLVAELESWKAEQQRAIVAACGRLMLTGVKIDGDGMLDAVDAVVAEVKRLRAENAHWKANHDEMKARNDVLRDRLDLDAEKVKPRLALIDRYDALRIEVERLRDVVAERNVERASLKAENARMRRELDGWEATQ